MAGGLRCNFRSDHIPENSLPPRVQHELLRIAQEAIHNAVRHASPTLITVTLRWDASNLVLQVKDNGCGISAARLEKSQGFGLRNMRERASQIDGRFEIQTAAGHGTTIVVTMPISEAAHQTEFQAGKELCLLVRGGAISPAVKRLFRS